MSNERLHFLQELHDLLDKYNVGIAFNVGEGTDTHGIVGERMVIEKHTGGWDYIEWFSNPYGWSIGARDLEEELK